MVKTFLCYPWNGEKEFTDQYNASCFCCSGDNCYLIGSLFGTINMVEVKNNTFSEVHKFPSVAIPVKMIFCEQKQFLLSLESRLQDYRTGVLTKEMNCQARVYYNITKRMLQKQLQSFNSGYSTNINTLTATKQEGKVMTIELTGIRQHVTDISVCNINNNIAVSSSRKIFVYAFKEFPSGKSSCFSVNIDFIRMIEIETTLVIRSVALALNWLAFSSKTEIRVIQIYLNQPLDPRVYQGEEATEMSETENNVGDQPSCISPENFKVAQGGISTNLDCNTTFWNFDQGNAESLIANFEDDSGVNLIKFQSIQEEKPYIDTTTSSKEVLGEHINLVGHPLCCSFVGQISRDTVFATVSSTTHLYCRFEEAEISFSGDADKIHSLQWLPVFVTGSKKMEEHSNMVYFPWRMFSKASTEVLLTMPLFFSTGNHGYVYDVYKSGDLITCYDYISDCHGALHTNSILYTLTSNGLDLYTSRLYPFSAAQYCQFVMENKEVINLTQHTKGAKTTQQERTDTDLFLETKCFNPSKSKPQDNTNQKETSSNLSKKNYTYSKETLLKPCPSKDLETCLIGMYQHRNLANLASSQSNIALLVKTPRQKEKSASDLYPAWNIISIQNSHVTEIWKEIKRLIEGNEFSNPTVYHQLLCEGYFFICSAKLSKLSDEKVVCESLKELASAISGFYMRSNLSFDFSELKQYFKLAEMQTKDVVIMLKKQSESTEKRNYSFGPGTIEYFNSILFGYDLVDFDKELNEFILHVYGKNCPSKLAKVIMHSKLKKDSSLDLCVKLLSRYKRKMDAKGKSLLPFDHLCFAFLHMQLGNPGHAEELLKGIPEESLKIVCVENNGLLLTNNEKLTTVGQLMRKYFKSTFQAILVSMFEKGKMNAESIMDLFKQTVDGTTMYGYQACEVLEHVLNSPSNRERHQEIILLLVDQYLVRLAKGLKSEGWKITHNHEIKGNGHFATRFTWLDKLPPFSGYAPTPNDCILNRNHQKSSTTEKQVSKSVSNTTNVEDSEQSEKRVSSYSNDASLLMRKREYCPCCCCSDVLMKFQSLLCSKLCRKEMCISVLHKLEDYSFVGKESLQLLCWPNAENSQEAIDYMVKNYPKLTLQYAKEMFDWKLQWQLLLKQILSLLTSNNFHWNQEVYLEILKGVLLRLTRAYSPKEFLDLLPPESSVTFMLPYLMECIEYSSSSNIKTDVLNTYKREEAPE